MHSDFKKIAKALGNKNYSKISHLDAARKIKPERLKTQTIEPPTETDKDKIDSEWEPQYLEPRVKKTVIKSSNTLVTKQASTKKSS